MPKHLLSACLLYIASRGALAILAPFYETGIARLTSPILMLLFVGIAIQFMRRAPWAWRATQVMVSVEIVITAVFFPERVFFGAYLETARFFAAIVIASSCVILWSMQCQRDTSKWFQRT